jgi:hypothetical protein
MKFHYSYFALLPNGHTVPAGDDWGPTPDTYKPGDSLGVKNGREGIVVGVARGGMSKRNAFDVMVLVVEHDQQDMVRRAPSREVIEAALSAIVAEPTPPPTIQTEWKEKNLRMVAIWNKLYPRPLTETFHEFLIEVPLKGTFKEDWHKEEMQKQENERHVVEQWLLAFYEQSRKNRPAEHQIGKVFGVPATGSTTELIALAHDFYMLQKVNRLPEKLVERLRNYNEFQGARYEVAIAAAFVKCGFEIDWMDDRTGPHPEFIARNKRTGEEAAVETKSRHRPGVLHQPGTLPPAEKLRADVDRLYWEALRQDPKDRPFVIFLDVNLPPNTDPGEVAKWQREIVHHWKNNEQQIALLGFTNFAWHYRGDERTPSTGPAFLLSVPIVSTRALHNPETSRCLQAVLNTYGVAPNEY